MTTITKKQFAEWSFERDRDLQLYDPSWTFSDLPADEQTAYLEEADYYLTSGNHELGYPEDILVRAKKEGVELP